ncbi:MAG: hypothetical protein R3332_10330 [Pseudohongiellaceae bacterium]|nr:hypothetical protein [Pseudohongiellaceae bacterium]
MKLATHLLQTTTTIELAAAKTINMSITLEQSIKEFIEQEKLPSSFRATAQQHYLPLAQHVLAQQALKESNYIVGINGAQGTGKSTLSLFLQRVLSGAGLRVVTISIDDLYLTRSEREALAQNVHPLLKTRGVPGTHDIAMGTRLLEQLMAADEDTLIQIPRFNKAEDDRYPQEQWSSHEGRADIIILEGWCVGAKPCDLSGDPINALERLADSEGNWRAYIQTQLNGEYQRFFDHLDMLVMLKAPSMECIIQWRTLQEHKLAQKLRITSEQEEVLDNSRPTDAPNKGIMGDKELLWFIMHYERLTRIMLATLPSSADVLMEIDSQHNITSTQFTDKTKEAAS